MAFPALHNQVWDTYPFEFKSKNSVFRKNVWSRTLRPNKRTRLVIKNGKFRSVLFLTVILC